MKTETYARRPFLVESVLVSSTNMAEAAEWCGGVVKDEKRGSRTVQYIYLDVSGAKSERQKKAYVGDRLLKNAGRGFKCYTPKAFDDCFEVPSEELLARLNYVPAEQDPLPDLAELGKKYAPGQS